MEMISLFSGIEAFEKALTNKNIKFNLKNYCENNKYSSKSYSLIHDVSEDLNLGDITKININKLSYVDLVTHGSPCQSFSKAGKQEGGDKDSNTKSSLMWNTVEIVKKIKPKYVIWENVKNVLNSEHIHNFEQYNNELHEIGYSNFYKVLNSCNYDVAQSRERIFVISILDCKKDFIFPKEMKLTKCLKDYLEKDVDEKYFLDKPYYLLDKPSNKKSHCKKIAMLDIKGRDSLKRIYDTNYCSPTLTAFSGGNTQVKILDNDRVRKLTPLEYFRLQTFSDEDFYKCKDAGISDTQLYRQAGNSITVKVLENIFENLFLK